MNTNYRTSPLTSYDPLLQTRAGELFHLVANCLGRSRVRIEKGSYSILGKSGNGVVAKIIIYDGRRSSALPEEGVYVLSARLTRETDPTIALGPWWNSRYRYVRVEPGQNLDETAALIAADSEEDEDTAVRVADVPSQRALLDLFLQDVVQLCRSAKALASAMLQRALQLCGAGH